MAGAQARWRRPWAGAVAGSLLSRPGPVSGRGRCLRIGRRGFRRGRWPAPGCRGSVPGTTVAPPSRTTAAPGAAARTASACPMAAIRPSRISMAPAGPASAAIVTKTPSSTTSSITLPPDRTVHPPGGLGQAWWQPARIPSHRQPAPVPASRHAPRSGNSRITGTGRNSLIASAGRRRSHDQRIADCRREYQAQLQLARQAKIHRSPPTARSAYKHRPDRTAS